MIQNAAARLVFNEPKRAHVTPLFISLHWLPLAARIKFKALTLAYRTITGSAPSYFHSLLQVYIPTRHLRSVNERRLVVPSQKATKSLSSTFSFTVPCWWNALPTLIRNAESLTTFKRQLKTNLFPQPKRETVTALVHAPPRDNVCIPPIKGLSNIVNRIAASESTNATEKTSSHGIEAKPKNRLKRKAAVDIAPKAKVPSDFKPQTSSRKKPRRSAAKNVVVDDNAVPDINDVQSWSDGLIESWDDCVFTPEPETQRRVPSSESVVAVEESDHEQLPSNQEAFRRESQPKIDIQHIFGLIQEAVNTTLNNIEVRLNKTLNERLNGFERRLDAYEKKHDVCECSTKAVLQQQGIWIKQVLAVQRLHRGDNQKEAQGQSLMVDLLKQVVFMLKKNHR
ncbi:unnamed protein product [Leuciscus chuanchicus]